MFRRKRAMKYLILTLVFGGAIACGIWFSVKDFFSGRKLYHDTTLVEETPIGSQWIEIDVHGRSLIVRDNQMLGIVLKEPAVIDIESGGLRIENGRVFNPTIQLVTVDNRVYDMIFRGARGVKIANYKFSIKPPDGESFTKVRIQSSNAIEAEKIIWTTYNIADMK